MRLPLAFVGCSGETEAKRQRAEQVGRFHKIPWLSFL
jgi:hypothetical protein